MGGNVSKLTQTMRMDNKEELEDQERTVSWPS